MNNTLDLTNPSTPVLPVGLALNGWGDYTSTFSASAVPPANAPTYEDMGNGIYSLRFSDGNFAFIDFHIQHDILVGSDVYPHVHWSPATTMSVGETVVWTIDYIVAKGHNQGESLSTATTQFTMTYTADGTEVAGEHMVTECSDVQAFLAPEVDSLVFMKVKRDVDTYTGFVFGHTTDLHYQVGSIATPNKAPNFYA